ncbi:hypothetical protein V6Z12_A13G208100 [Gossypium hirsutum]
MTQLIPMLRMKMTPMILKGTSLIPIPNQTMRTRKMHMMSSKHCNISLTIRFGDKKAKIFPTLNKKSF